MLEPQKIEALRNSPIENVATQLSLSVSHHRACCPFHADRHPSLTFDRRRNRYKCFVCGANGDPIDLVMSQLHLSFTAACKWLAEERNVLLEKQEPVVKPKISHPPDLEFLSYLVARPTLNEAAKQFLFDERRIDPRVVRWLGISSLSLPTACWRYGRPYFDAPSLLIPYRDPNGQLLSVQSRYLGDIPGKARFKFPKGSKCAIYNLPVLQLLKEGEPLYITEGVTDCMAMLSAGHKAIAIPSATLLSKADKALLRAFASKRSALDLHMYPDADVPGEQLYLQLLDLANEIGASLKHHSLPPGYKDFGHYWSQQAG